MQRPTIPTLLRQVQDVLGGRDFSDPSAMRLALHEAVDESLAKAGLYNSGAAIVARLGRLLEMSHEDMARIFRVSGETVRRWERAEVRIPTARLAELESMAAACDRLEALFKSSRIPQLIRRPAELFGGESALAWIERGRIGEVADRYETAFSYQA